MAQKRIGDYQIRLQVLPMTLGPKAGNGSRPETWPSSGNAYSAAEESLSGGEQMTQGIRGTTGFRKLRIPGAKIPVQAVDRVKLVATDELYNVTGVARDYTANETVLSLDRVAQQSQPQ